MVRYEKLDLDLVQQA